MSEGDVSLIRDEDVLRRMWQQTEDFSRKKEIRTHMYRLREERLRNLYSPEPGADTKGCEFTSTQGHVKSFADQNFQSMKSKEVRDAGSPPKEFTYHGQGLNALSNAGWNVESENRTTDDGHTHVKSVHANIEGRYDVDGGHGQFAAVDHNKQAVTEYDDGNTSLKRNENVSNTAAHEQVMRKTEDGTQFSSTKSSSSSTSKIEQFSSKRETMPCETVEDFDLTSNKIYDNNRHNTNRSEEITSNKFTRTNDYEENLRNDYDNGELVSRKIDYPDENTKVIVETRCLPNGTRVTSTRREFRAPSIQTSHSEKQSHQTRSESKSSYTSSQKRSHVNESSTNILRETTADTTDNIVDSQKNIDDYDFQKNKYSINRNNDYENNVNNQYRNQSTYESRDNKSVRQEVVTSKNDDYTQQRDINDSQSVEGNESRTHHIINKSQNVKNVEDKYNYISEPVRDVHDSIYNIRDNAESVIVEDRANRTINKNQSVHNIEDRHHETREDVVVERKTSTEKYQSTYQTDFTQKKISNDWSPAQQAWASTLRSDTPTRPSTRASSPGSKTFKSSTSSLRSSVSPDKTNRKTGRGGSPSKVDRNSPTRPISEKPSSMHFTPSVPENKNKYSSPDRKSPETYRSRSSTSPAKTFNIPSSSPVKEREDTKPDNYVRTKSPSKSRDKSVSPQRSPLNYNKEPVNQIYTPIKHEDFPHGSDASNKNIPNTKKSESYLNEDLTPKPNNIRNTYSPDKTKPAEEIQRKPSLSPDRKNKHPKPSSPIKSATEPIQRHFKEPSPTRANPLDISDYQPGYMRPTASSKPKCTDNSAPVNESPESSSKSPDRKTYENTVNRLKEDHYKFIDEETKMYSVDENRQTVQTTKMNISSDKETLDSPKNKEFSRDRSNSPNKNSRQSLPRKSPIKDVSMSQTLPTENDSLKTRVSPSKILNSKTQSSESPIDSSVPKESRLQSKSPSPTRKRLTNSEPQSYSDSRSVKSKSPSPDKFSPTRYSPNKEKCFPDSVAPKNETDNTSDLNDKHEPEYVNTDSIPKGPSKVITNNKKEKVYKKNETSPDRNSYPFDSTSVRSRTPSPIKNTSRTTKVQSVDIKKIAPKNEKDFSSDLNNKHEPIKYVNTDSIPKGASKPITSNKEEKVYKKNDTSPDRNSYPFDRTSVRSRTPSPIKNTSHTTKVQSVDIKKIAPKNEKDFSSDLNNKHEPIKYVNTDSIPKGASKPITSNKEEKVYKKNDTSPDRNSYPFDRTSVRSRTPSPIKNTSHTTKVQSIDIKKHTSKNVKTSDIYTEDLLRQNNVYTTVDKDSKAPRTQSRQSSKDKSPRNSPVKFSHTSTFIELEKTNEEFNKNTLKERPRQLITPSTSPTRKPKTTETTALSGQSSPTTSVSGFEYFPSDTNKTAVTDLDEQLHTEYTNVYTKTTNENLKDSQIQLSISSRIPCRSPSPEKRPTKETLPRKSSLKKTSNNQITPTEKPPSSFLISPNIETKEFVDQKVIIQDNPSKENDKPIKTKPPFERRETYEERCRKILGMVETDTNESEKINITTDTKTSLSNLSSPSVSPCRSPSFERENSPNEDFNKMDMKNKEIVSHEMKENKQTTISLKDISDNRKASKIPTRDVSPTKLQDITSISETNKKYTKDKILNIENESDKSTTITTEETNENVLSDKSLPNSKYTRSSISPEKTIGKKTSPYITEKTQADEIDNQIPQKKPQTKPSNLVEPSKNQTFKRIDSPERNPVKTRNDKSVNRFSKIPKDDSIIATDKELKPNVAIVSSEYEIQHTTESVIEENIDTIDDEVHYARSKTPLSPERKIPAKICSPIKHVNVFQQQENVVNKKSNTNTDFISSEKEKEVLDRVQKSLRKLSPDRTNKYSKSEKEPCAKNIPASTNLHDLEIVCIDDRDITSTSTNTVMKSVKNITNVDSKYTEKQTFENDKKISNKPPSRNASPTKKSSNVSPVPVRSVSPKKPISATERPHSPLISKISGVKPREQITSHIRKPSPSTVSTTKVEKTVTDIKKSTTSTNKQSNNTKLVTNKYTSTKTVPVQTSVNKDQEQKRLLTSKTSKDSVRKDLDTKVFTTKKSLPQKIKSKPEIQVNDVTPGKLPKHTSTTLTKTQIFPPKEQQIKLPTSKPKSATALNTSTDEDDVIIDVQQAKSSRENSPDRICPTPVGFSEDIGTPRFPDEVNEPDDEYLKRTYQTIHEAETIVDDIVEINEDDELFVKRTDTDETAEERLLRINDKVTRPASKIENDKTKSTTARFRETEKQVHSDFIDDNLKSDDCLLSVSEKVNKFAKGPLPTKDNRSPSRNIVEEYDKQTTYQDDYTKLSVNDKAHLFIETAENVKTTKSKPTQKIERPDLSDVDDTLRSDDCLLSVSDKVNKFVKTAEQFLNESYEIEEKEKKIKEQHEKIMKKLVENIDENVLKKQDEEHSIETTDVLSKTKTNNDDRQSSFAKETVASNAKGKDHSSPNLKPAEKSTVKITTLRSSDAVKKAKALFENIASTTATTHKNINSKSPKAVDKMVTKKATKVDSINIQQYTPENESETPKRGETLISHAPVVTNHTTSSDSGKVLKEMEINYEETPRSSPARLKPRSPERVKSKSPTRLLTDTTQVRSSVDFPKHSELETDRPEKQQEKVIPNYQRPTKTSQNKEETKVIEESEIVSSRRGSGKFGVELRRMSNERSTPSNERRRSSVEHHQPCIEDIFELDLLEQMLEKVVGYEQRRRIRAQIRVAKKRIEKEEIDTHTSTKTKHTVTRTNKLRSPERHHKSPERPTKVGTQRTDSPDRQTKITPQKFSSPDRDLKSMPQTVLPKPSAPLEQNKSLLNDHVKEPHTNITERLVRPQSPSKISSKPKSPVRPHSPEKKSRPLSPAKSSSTKPKSNRFNEYASAYMKKVGLKESDKITELKTKRNHVEEQKTRKIESQSAETKFTSATTKITSERTISKDKINSTRINGKRSPSPEYKLNTKQYEQENNTKQFEQENRISERQNSPNRKTHSPERMPQSPERRQQSPLRSPSPEMVRQKSDIVKTQTKKETIIKTVYDIEKKIPQIPKQEEKPSWITNRNLKKTSETRSFTTKKAEPEKSKYRTLSPSKVISKPIDVITSSYGPGPLDADGRPLFGIKALRNGSSNYQVKGTVIRQEFHSRNGGEPEGTVSVTAYSTEPEDLEKLLQSQGEKPSKIHGLAAITTTKKFGGDTGTSFSEVHNKEERAVLDQFTHSDRKVSESRITSNNFDRTDEFIHKEKQISDNDRYAQRNRVGIIDGATEKGYKEIKSEKETVNKQKQKMQSDKERKVELERRGRERMEKSEKREEKKTVRQSSVKSLTEKYIKSASETSKSERHVYPKAGLILRTSTMKDSISSDSSAHAGLTRTDSEHSLGSDEEVVTTTTTEQIGDGVKTTTTTTTRSGHTRATERSFLDSSTKVTGVQDILTRMKNADIVIEEGDSSADTEARALLNKFLGATVLMAGMQNYVTEKPTGKVVIKQETVQSSGGKVNSSRHIEEFDIDQCWDERVLRKLLDECTDYEQRRRLRARIRTLMAEQEACASAVTEALAAAGETVDAEDQSGEREEEEVTTVTSSIRRNSSEKTVSSSTTTIKNSKVIESMTRPAPKPVSPFAKFRQLEKQNSTNSPNSPKSPQSPGSPSQPYFKFTDPALQASAVTIKERLLQWCRDKTREYENVKLENFSTSWADGLAFCALVHHFLPNTFDYSKLTPERRRHNFTLAFKVADEKAGIYPLLDVDDMVAMRKPDWKCVFTYVQSIYRRFKDEQ